MGHFPHFYHIFTNRGESVKKAFVVGLLKSFCICFFTQAGRPRPPPSARVIDKRVGPFFTNEQRRIYNHPYMDDHYRVSFFF